MKHTSSVVQAARAPVIAAATRVPQRTSAWRTLRVFLHRHSRLLKLTRALSALFWLGPWRSIAIQFFQWRAANPPLPRAATSVFTGTEGACELDVAQLVAQLNEEGFARGLQLPSAVIEEILAYCAAQPRNHHAHPHLACRAIHQLAHDPFLLSVVKAYLGTEPRLFGTQMYWTHPPTSEEKRRVLRQRKAQFHYDLGDFKAASIFFYLTDVTADCGPHVLIPGTHHSKSLRQLCTRYLSDESAQALYGDRITTVLGPPGSGFFENLACYHKHAFGTRERLMLTLTYVLQRTPMAPATAAKEISG